jgi:energy-coupling factor transporter transmembrane protein EcfT
MKQQGLLACIKQRRDEDTEMKEGGGVDGCTLILRVPLSHVLTILAELLSASNNTSLKLLSGCEYLSHPSKLRSVLLNAAIHMVNVCQRMVLRSVHHT